jgi:hypothetical protein
MVHNALTYSLILSVDFAIFVTPAGYLIIFIFYLRNTDNGH